jgi:hypothetical protein
MSNVIGPVGDRAREVSLVATHFLRAVGTGCGHPLRE